MFSFIPPQNQIFTRISLDDYGVLSFWCKNQNSEYMFWNNEPEINKNGFPTNPKKQMLDYNTQLASEDADSYLWVKYDGNLVIYDGKIGNTGNAIWASNTSSSSNPILMLDSAGLHLMDIKTGEFKWSASSLYPNQTPTYFRVQQYQLIMYNSTNDPIWASLPNINRYKVLLKSQYISNGTYKLVMQTDGNLVVYQLSNNAVLAYSSSYTSGSPNYYLIVDNYGDFGIYDIDTQNWVNNCLWMDNRNADNYPARHRISFNLRGTNDTSTTAPFIAVNYADRQNPLNIPDGIISKKSLF